jgi:CHAT domain-containing protein
MTNQPRPRLLGLFAEPLIDGSGRPVPTLAVDEEREELAAWLEDVDVDIDFEPGGLDDFEKSFVPTVTAVHFSGHGLEDGLALEDRLGRLKLLRKDDLAAIIAAYNEGNVQLVFLSACHSETTCELVVKAGVPIVVGILRQAAVADQAARDFARAFYRQLGAWT